MTPSPSDAGSGANQTGFMPLMGLNSTDNYAAIAQGEVSDCANMLFDSGLAYSRPGLTVAAVTGLNSSTSVVFGDNISINGSLHNILIGSDNAVYDYAGTGLISAAGSAASFGSNIYNNICSILGVMYAGNNAGGLVQWNPSGSTYALITGAPFRYVAGHQGRAVAAFQLAGGSSSVNSRTLAWSKPGDPTTWTSTDGSAGQLAIAECEDQITGLGVLHNIVVILRSYGIHLAYATGTLPLPFNVQTFIRRGSGCLYPSTAGWSEEAVFFVGEDDVYQFDLQTVKPIGYKIRATLIPILKSGVPYRGFVTKSILNGKPRTYYHLVPLTYSGHAHLTYDVMADSWSQHTYTNTIAWAWNYSVSGSYVGCTLVDTGTSPSLRTWDASVATEIAAYITRYCGILDHPDTDYTIMDVILKNLDYGANSVTLAIKSTLGLTVTTASVTVSPIGTINNTGRFVRNWLSRSGINVQLVGNEFLVTITSPANEKFAMNYFNMRLANPGEYRG